MSNMVTRCPKCATSFRITSAQLQSAKGSVRCGSCLHIFKAQEHLAGGETTSQAGVPAKTTAAVAAKVNPTPEAAKTSQTPVAKGPGDLAARKVNVNSSHPEANQAKSASSTKAVSKPANQTRPAPTTTTPDKSVASAITPGSAKPAAINANRGNPPHKNATPVAPDKKVEQKRAPVQKAISREISSDEDFLISDDMDEASSKKEASYEFGELIELEKLPSHSISLFDREARKEEPEEADNTDESWAMDLLDDADDDTKLASMKRDIERKEQNEDEDEFERYSNNLQHDRDEPAPEKTRFSGHVFSLVGEKSDSVPSPEEIHAQPYSNNHLYQQAMSDAKDDSQMRAQDTSRSALLMNIMPEPVIMTSRRKGNWSRKKLWAGLSLLMLVPLLAQIAWLQFDKLNRSEPYRSAYAIVCPVLGCKLPALIDRSKIRAYNLVVRNHPSANTALIVDAIILNNATFQQPFPDLVLEFSTIDDKPVAVRRFTPKEYLGGELAGQHLMPPNQPVHLTLELVDPGPEAVNYRAYIPE